MTVDRPPNSLLAILPDKGYQRLLPRLEPVTLKLGDELYRPGEAIRHVYFPNDCLVSLITLVEGHLGLEVGLIGREGMLGIPLALGVKDSMVQAVVLASGTAMRMRSAHFLNGYAGNRPLQRAVCRYIHDQISQLTLTAACNRFHGTEARLARWLLMTRDRVRSDDFLFTQEMLANVLGVLRVSVTNSAGMLQKRRLIRYNRGKISIRDSKGLEAAACECYRDLRGAPMIRQARPARPAPHHEG